MNEYYRVLFGIVERYGGEISDTAGDSMVAIWASAEPDAQGRAQALRAALAILEGVESFNNTQRGWRLPTRVGLESGELLLGNIGARQRYEYRAIGDIVNTASRIQGLNRLLGTRVLVSAGTLVGVSGTAVRDVGTFLLRGKRQPVQVYEPLQASTARLDEPALALFAEALALFRSGAWVAAREHFAAFVAQHPDDGPGVYYETLASQNEKQPPSAGSHGVVEVEK
jgi:adenylate cyclase